MLLRKVRVGKGSAIEGFELSDGHFIDAAGADRGMVGAEAELWVGGEVVVKDELMICGQGNVEFEGGDAALDGELKGGEGVFGASAPGSAMPLQIYRACRQVSGDRGRKMG